MDLENFPTSESAIRMLDMVNSGWYDKSYVGKWLFQVMGMEVDTVKTLFEELRQQAFVESATWALGYWEEKYGVARNGNLSLEKRRNRIKEICQLKYSMNPERIKKIAETICEKKWRYRNRHRIHSG